MCRLVSGQYQVRRCAEALKGLVEVLQGALPLDAQTVASGVADSLLDDELSVREGG